MMMEPTTAQIRNSLRQTFRERRKRLSQSERISQADKLIEQCISNQLFDTKQRVALYFTHDGELDTQPLIEYLWSQGKDVYLPVLHPFCDGHLLFLNYHSNANMTVNHYGIAEPRLDVRDICPLQSLDILFTPLVAFDEKGNRLGMGGGFYDRTLSVLKKTKQVSVIGLAYDIQKTLSLPTEAWDMPLPKILTPTNLYQF